jgi:hypothetical protein
MMAGLAALHSRSVMELVMEPVIAIIALVARRDHKTDPIITPPPPGSILSSPEGVRGVV